MIKRVDKILLVRGAHLPAGMYSTLAGFVEPGESLEEAVEREVGEEVGLRVKTSVISAVKRGLFRIR